MAGVYRTNRNMDGCIIEQVLHTGIRAEGLMQHAHKCGRIPNPRIPESFGVEVLEVSVCNPSTEAPYYSRDLPP